MEVTTALLCDFAQVREGLLFVSSGGITRCWRDEFPAALGVQLALIIEVDEIESKRPHELQVVVVGEDGKQYGELKGGFQIERGPEARPHEKTAVPMTIDLRPVGVDKYGPYDISIYVDGQHRRTLTAWVAARPDQAPTPGT